MAYFHLHFPISGSADQTQTLLHYTVHALSNTRMEILKCFGNRIIIFIIDYFMEVSAFSALCSKNFIILGIFTNILLSWDNPEKMWNLWRSQENSWDLAALLIIFPPSQDVLLVFQDLSKENLQWNSLWNHWPQFHSLWLGIDIQCCKIAKVSKYFSGDQTFTICPFLARKS